MRVPALEETTGTKLPEGRGVLLAERRGAGARPAREAGPGPRGRAVPGARGEGRLAAGGEGGRVASWPPGREWAPAVGRRPEAWAPEWPCEEAGGGVAGASRRACPCVTGSPASAARRRRRAWGMGAGVTCEEAQAGAGLGTARASAERPWARLRGLCGLRCDSVISRPHAHGHGRLAAGRAARGQSRVQEPPGLGIEREEAQPHAGDALALLAGDEVDDGRGVEEPRRRWQSLRSRVTAYPAASPSWSADRCRPGVRLAPYFARNSSGVAKGSLPPARSAR